MPKNEMILVSILGIVLLMVWWPTRNLPFWWDSAGTVVHTALHFLKTNFKNLLPKEADFARPPFFPLLLAIFWKISDQSLFVAHFFVLIFAFLVLIYTFFLGKEIIKNDLGNFIGFFSAILLLSTPSFLGQLGIVYVEIPTLAFALMAVYYAIKKEFSKYLISASLMVLTKEVAILVLLVISFYIFFEKISLLKKEGRKLDLIFLFKETFPWLFPFLVFFSWLLYHRILAGWWLVAPGRRLGGALSFSQRLMLSFYYLFFAQGRFWLSLFFFGLIFRNLEIIKKFINLKILLIFLLLIAPVLFFGVIEFMPRYLLLTLPFLYLLFFYFLTNALLNFQTKRKLFIFSFLALFFVFSFLKHWQIRSDPFSFNTILGYLDLIDTSLGYLDLIELNKKAAKFLEKYFPDKTILTTFPAHFFLLEPIQGYATAPLNVKSCLDYKEGEGVDLILLSFFAPGQKSV